MNCLTYLWAIILYFVNNIKITYYIINHKYYKNIGTLNVNKYLRNRELTVSLLGATSYTNGNLTLKNY